MSEPSDNITLHIYDIIIHEKDVTVQVTEKRQQEADIDITPKSM